MNKFVFAIAEYVIGFMLFQIWQLHVKRNVIECWVSEGERELKMTLLRFVVVLGEIAQSSRANTSRCWQNQFDSSVID